VTGTGPEPGAGGLLVYRKILAGFFGFLVVVWVLAMWNPINLVMLQHRILYSGFLPVAFALMLGAVEATRTASGCVLRCFGGLLCTLIALVILAAIGLTVGSGKGSTEVAAVSPDGRVRAEWVASGFLIGSWADLVLIRTDGLDRRVHVLDGCTKPSRGIPPVRLPDNHTLEIGPVGQAVRIHFDRNLNHKPTHASCE
jgi:hypothetical protein